MAILKDINDIKIPRETNFAVVLLYFNLHIFTFFSPFILKSVSLWTYVFGKYNLLGLLQFCGSARWFLGAFLVFLGVLGATAGAHRLWAHRAYVADVKLRIFLMLCFCISGQGTIYNWILEHRLHHKYFGTKLDPFNKDKSIINLQIIARLTKPTGGYDKLKELIDMSDLENDAVVMFQKK